MNPQVGDSAERSRTISSGDIELFTELTGDANPLHYDVALADASRFRGIIVQGGVTTGLLNAVVSEELPGPGSVFMNVNWDFRAPVRPGDTITARVVVRETREDKPISLLECSVTNQAEETVVEGTALVWTEPLP